MSDEKLIFRKNHGNFSCMIFRAENKFHVMKFVKIRSRAKITGDKKTRRRIIFDEILTANEVAALDDGILKDFQGSAEIYKVNGAPCPAPDSPWQN